MNCDGFPEPGCENDATNRVLGYDLCDSCARAYAGMSEATQDDDEITPSMAIRSVTFDLRFRKSDWVEKGHDDPNGLVPHMEKLIAALELAQWELGEYRKLIAALAVLRAAMP